MDHTLETDVAAGASAGGFLAWRRQHTLPPGARCYNCATVLQGPWCHACGQLGEDFHRSAHHLIWETMESFFHADGRLWKTLPRLLLRPASLTCDYLAGKRAPQVPPLRLFLVVLLLVFLAGTVLSGPDHIHFVDLKTDASDRAELQKLQVHVYAPWDDWLTSWTRVHLGQAVEHPDQLANTMGAWAHDFAFLALPLSALILAAMFVFRRRFVLFDHLVFSMHSLSFQGLLFATALGADAATGHGAFWLFALSPVHLFGHMRGVYGTGTIGTLVRMAVLFTVSSIVFAVLMLALVLVGLASLKP